MAATKKTKSIKYSEPASYFPKSVQDKFFGKSTSGKSKKK